MTQRFPLAACLLALAACGGGHDDGAAPFAAQLAAAASPAPAAAAEGAATVRLEGCVSEEFYLPRAGTPVRATDSGGRLLGHATSGGDGVFTLRVAAGQHVTLAVDKPGGEDLLVPVGRTDLTVTTCLRDPRR